MPDPVSPVPVTPRVDVTVADTATLEQLGVVDPQPTPDPDPPPVDESA